MTDLYLYYLLARAGWAVALVLFGVAVALAVRLRAAKRNVRMSPSGEAQWMQVARTFGWPR